MAHTADDLAPQSAAVLEHYRSQVRTRRLYTIIALAVFAIVLGASLNFANAANSGKFFDRLPYMFDFLKSFVPNDPLEIFRAMFDLPSPYADGSQKFDYVSARHYITDTLYIPHFIYQLMITVNVAIVSTIIGGGIAFCLCFFAATNLVGAGAVRFFVRRVMEVLRAFPEIVIAGLLTAIISIGPIAAIFAVSLHTIGALGKLFFEVVENADMKPDEGLRAVGGSWLERVRYGMLPQVLPNFVSYGLLRLEINVRASTIIGAVGGGGIGDLAIRYGYHRFNTEIMFATIVLLIVLVQLIQASGNLIASQILKNRRR